MKTNRKKSPVEILRKAEIRLWIAMGFIVIAIVAQLIAIFVKVTR